MIGNASATYRGYRKQGLYALARILEDADQQHVYRPEGDEDLAVYDSGSRLLEAVQVKDYTDGLKVSDLKPTSPNGFFSRMAARLRTDPQAPTVLASFGPIGPELDAAIRGQAPQRSKVVAKLQPLIG